MAKPAAECDMKSLLFILAATHSDPDPANGTAIKSPSLLDF